MKSPLMPAEPEHTKEQLREMLETEQARAEKELRRIKLAWLASALCLGAALVLWLFFGGRAEFVSRSSGYSATVLVPGWLALLGIIAATVAAVLFMMRLMRGALGNIVERDARKNRKASRRHP